MGVVFVHGFRSSEDMWEPFTSLMAQDADLESIDALPFSYATRLWQPDPRRGIPSFDTVADSLKEFLDTEAESFRRLVLVGHSQGGLVIQRCLARMLAEGRGVDLARILRIVLFACPNNGSQFAMTLRRRFLGGNVQERQLRPLDEQITDTQRIVMRDVVHAAQVGERTCPIPFSVYAGESDNIVTPPSARSVFPNAGVLPGGHSSIVRPTSRKHRSYTTLRRLLLDAAGSDPPCPCPPPAPARAPAPLGSVPSTDLPLPLVPSLPRPSHWQGGLAQGLGDERPGAPLDATGRLADRIAGTSVLSGLPPAPQGFTGREAEIERLLDFLRPVPDPQSTSSVPVMQLAGMAGVGKSALVLHAAHEAQAQGWFGGGTLFLNLGGHGPAGPLEPGAAAGQLLRALGVHEKDLPPTADEILAMWRDRLVLLAQQRSPVLVILDNALDAGHVAPLLPGTSSCHRLLITSRYTLSALDTQLMNVPVLPSGEAALLIQRALRVARPDDQRADPGRADAVRLAELCGGLPLALLITAAVLRSEPDRPLRELAEELEDARTRLDVLSLGDTDTQGRELAVRAALDLSCEHLPPEQARLFRLLTVNPGRDMSTEAAAALAGRPVPGVRRLLAALARAHLIEGIRTPGAGQRWSMHDLVLLYAREQGEACADTDERETALRRLFTFYVRRAVAVSCCIENLDTVPPSERFTSPSEAVAWVATEDANLIATGFLALQSGYDVAAYELIRNLGEYPMWWGVGDELMDLTRLALDRAANDAATALEMRLAHAAALVSAERPTESVEILLPALEAATSAADREGEAYLRLSLGVAYRHAEQYDASVEHCRAAVELFTDLGLPRRTGTALNSLGNSLRGAGCLADAVATHRRAAAVFRQAGVRRSEAISLNNIGNALVETENFEEGLQALRAAAGIFQGTGDKHGELNSQINLAQRLGEHGRLPASAQLWLEIADSLRDRGDQTGELTALAESVKALEEIGEIARAVDACRRAAEVLSTRGEHGAEGLAWRDAASLLAQGGQYAAAAVLCARAIVLLTGEDRAQAEQILRSVLAQQESGAPGAQADVLMKAADLLADADLHLCEGLVRHTAGTRLQLADRADESVAALQRAASVFAHAGDRALEGCALNNLGVSLRSLGRYGESAGVIRQDVSICRENGDRRGEATSLCNLAETLSASGATAAALDCLRRAEAILEETGAEPQAAEVRARITAYANETTP